MEKAEILDRLGAIEQILGECSELGPAKDTFSRACDAYLKLMKLRYELLESVLADEPEQSGWVLRGADPTYAMHSAAVAPAEQSGWVLRGADPPM